MKNILKFLGISFALILLVMSQQFSATSAEAAVAEDDVQWLSIGGGTAGTANAATKADKVKYYAPSDIASFFIRDGVLNSATAGLTRYSCTGAPTTIPDNEAHNLAATAGDPVGVACTTTEHLDDASETSNATYIGAATPLVAGSLTLKVGSLVIPIDTIDESAGTFALNGASGYRNAATTMGKAYYSFNTQQTYANSTGLNDRRAHVVSTSDGTGEWISIIETDSEGGAHNVAAASANDSSIFVGRVAFSTDAAHAAAGTDNGASVSTIWVADGDTVTVTYYAAGSDADSSATLEASEIGAVIDTATFTVDSEKPTITNISPADGTLTKDSSPQISFTIEDSGIGFESTSSTIGNHVDMKINGCTVNDAELNASSHSTSAITVTFDLDVTKAWNGGFIQDDNDSTVKAVGTACSSTAAANANARSTTVFGGFGVASTARTTDATLDRTIHGTKFTWEIIAKDDAGNTNTITGNDLEIYMDTVVPTVTSVTGAQKWDATAKATTTTDASNTIEILMAESVDASTVSASDFVVSGTGVTDATISSVLVTGDDASAGTYIYLTMGADLGPNATPKVELVGQISDLAGNVWKVPSGDADGKVLVGSATDGVKSTISNIAIDDQSLDTLEKATLTFTANENLVSSGSTGAGACTCVYVYGDFDNTNGATFVPHDDNADGTVKNYKKVDVTLTDTKSGKATFTENSAPFRTDTAGIYGVLIRGRDAAGNIGRGGITKISNQDISDKFTSLVSANATVTVKLTDGPIADPDGNLVGAAADNMQLGTIEVTDDGGATTETLTNINWSEAEEISFTLGADVAAGSQVRLTYHVFDATNVIEVDEAAPAVTVTPGSDSSTEDARNRITFAFDEDEYAFDSMTTVTVTKAELKNVTTKVVTDILGSLITSDDKSFYYKPTSDLALGQHEVKVSATDSNGNALTDSTSKFTVVERSKTTVAMEAGWNLISLPGTPTDTAINSVITNTEVTTVLTYDPSIPGGWLTAVRDGASLVGTLSTMDASRGYWIYQEDGDDIKTLIPGSTSGVQQVPPALALVKGWNLVPMVTLNLATSKVEADDYFANIDWNKAKGWNAVTEKWFDVLKAQDIVDTDNDGLIELDANNDGNDTNTGAHANNTHDLNDLVPGKGYWVFANKAGTIIP